MTTELAKTSSVPTVRAMLESDRFRSEIAKALPQTIGAQRFLRLALTALVRTPDLGRCTQSSVAQCLLDCAQLGLEPGGPLGRAHLIPFNDRKKGTVTCTLIVGYKGLLELAFRSGKLLSIRAEVVRKGDEFLVEYGLEDKLVHRPDLEQAGDIIAAYALARLEGGACVWTVMPRSEIDGIRRRARAGETGPWVSDYAEMAKKTVLRRLLKLVPMATEADLALEAEDRSHVSAGIYQDALSPVVPIQSQPQVQEMEAPPAEPVIEAAPVDVDAQRADPDLVRSVTELAASKRITGGRWQALARRVAATAGITITSTDPDELPGDVLAAIGGELTAL